MYNLHSNLELKIGDIVVKPEPTLKILGIVLDQDLKYTPYISSGKQSVLGFMRSRNAVLKILSKSADFKTRKALAEGLVLSKLGYGCTVWMGGNLGEIDKLGKEMNVTLRTVWRPRRGRNSPRYDDLYKQLRWLQVYDNIKYHCAITLDSIIRFSTPMDLADKFRKSYDWEVIRNSKNTRVRTKLRVHHSNNTKRKKGFVVKASRLRSKTIEALLDVDVIPRRIYKECMRSWCGNLPLKETTLEFLLNHVETSEDLTRDARDSLWRFIEDHE